MDTIVWAGRGCRLVKEGEGRYALRLRRYTFLLEEGPSGWLATIINRGKTVNGRGPTADVACRAAEEAHLGVVAALKRPARVLPEDDRSEAMKLIDRADARRYGW